MAVFLVIWIALAVRSVTNGRSGLWPVWIAWKPCGMTSRSTSSSRVSSQPNCLRPLPNSPTGSGDWQVLESSVPPVGQMTLAIDLSVGPHCYRTSFSEEAATFSSSTCVDGTGS